MVEGAGMVEGGRGHTMHMDGREMPQLKLSQIVFRSQIVFHLPPPTPPNLNLRQFHDDDPFATYIFATYNV